jgi:hypothetical protein
MWIKLIWSTLNRLNCGDTLRASRSYNVTGNGGRECGTAKAHTIRILGIGLSGMEVAQTHRNSLQVMLKEDVQRV